MKRDRTCGTSGLSSLTLTLQAEVPYVSDNLLCNARVGGFMFPLKHHIGGRQLLACNLHSVCKTAPSTNASENTRMRDCVSHLHSTRTERPSSVRPLNALPPVRSTSCNARVYLINSCPTPDKQQVTKAMHARTCKMRTNDMDTSLQHSNNLVHA